MGNGHARSEEGGDVVQFSGRAPSALVKYLIGALIGVIAAGGGAAAYRRVETGGESPAVLVEAAKELQAARGEITTLRSRADAVDDSQRQLVETLTKIQESQAELVGEVRAMRRDLDRTAAEAAAARRR